MLDTTTKKRIDDCRDILVGKLPDPKAQIEQITIGLIYKFMDDMDKEAVELGGKTKFFSNYMIPDPENPGKEKLVEFEKYSWDRLFDAKVTASEMLTLYSEAIVSMDKNLNIPQLFRDIFKNAYLPYRDPETLKMFLKTISEFEYTHSEKLGDAFEYLLSVMGSQGDAGQFRTPRHIIDFLVAVVGPQKTDTILDPACGTAGFLISAFKYMMNGGDTTPDERRRIIGNFTGYDISPDMVRLSLVNLYLHGFSDPHIWEYDTLSSEDRWKETFDVILANPPFMSPKGGIRPHKKFSISSNRSEVLFVDYIAEHLNPKGRAGIIVPEGVIFQSGTAYKDLRKMLVENYLYAVVSLPAGVFNPYSGVKTSILLMDKAFAKTCNEILFVKIDNDGFGLGAQRNAVKGGQLDEAIEVIKNYKLKIKNEPLVSHAERSRSTGYTERSQTIAHVVPKSEIANLPAGKAGNGDYNLSGERYKVQVQLQTVFPSYDFEDTIEKVVYSNKIKSSDYKESGMYPIIDQSDIFIAGFWDNKEDVFKIKKPVTIFGDHTRCFKYIDFDFVLGADGVKILQPIDKYNPRFYYYLIREIQINNLGYSRHFKELKDKKIPLPPISIQQEIVAEIEGYQKIIDGAKMVVENYKPKIDINPEWKMVELGEVCEINPKKSELKDLDENTEVSFVPMADLNENQIDFEPKQSKPLGEVIKGYTYFKDDDVLLAKVTPCFENGKAGIAKDLVNGLGFGSSEYFVLRPNDKILSTWIYLNVITNSFREKGKLNMTGTGGLQRVPPDFVKSTLISLPDIETQHQIVFRIEKEQELVNASKQLIEIFGQKIKDRIARVWGVDTPNQPEMLMAAEPQPVYNTNFKL